MKCLLDLDGVMADFVGGVMKKEGIDPSSFVWPEEHLGSWDLATALGISTEQMWSGTDTVSFWRDLQPTPEMEDIKQIVIENFGRDNVAILTSPSQSPYSIAGKVYWVEDHLPEFRKNLLVGSAKHFCAHRDAVLIDDADHNLEAFDRHGGYGVIVPRLWNRAYELADQPIKGLGSALSAVIRFPVMP